MTTRKRPTSSNLSQTAQPILLLDDSSSHEENSSNEADYKRSRLESKQQMGGEKGAFNLSVDDTTIATSLPLGSQDVADVAAIDSGIRLTYVEPAGPKNNINCVSLSDLLQGNIDQMLQLNYLIDVDFLFGHLNERSRNSAEITLVHGHRDNRYRLDVNTRNSRLNIITPALPISYGTHHTKAMFIIYTDGTAIFHIHTANIIFKDWNLKTQAVWSSPVLVKKRASKSTETAVCAFEQDLLDYLAVYGNDLSGWRQIITQYDFSHVKAKLIASVPGYHQGDQRDRWGHMQLRKTLARHVAPTDQNTSYLVAQFSSVGSLGAQSSWLLDEFGQSLSAQQQEDSDIIKTDAKSIPLKLIYPTCQQVETSFEGIEAGYSLPFDGKNYAAQKHYMDPLLHLWTASNIGRDMAMPHVKSYTRICTTKTLGTTLAWFLLTSANLSKAAWGQLQKKNTQLMIRSYELGVLILPNLYETNDKSIVIRPSNLDNSVINPTVAITANTVAVTMPYDLPLVPYDEKLEDVCWTWNHLSR